MANSVEKTMQVLRVLSDAKGAPVPLQELAGRLNINKSTLSHILKVLCEERYVLRISRSEGYTLGPELYLLTRHGRYGEDLITLCRPILRMLYRKSGGSVMLAVLKGGHKYHIDYIDGLNFFSEENEGRTSIMEDKVYRTVTGRVLLAYSPIPEALSVYETLGNPEPGFWPEVSCREEFLQELAVIRAKTCYYRVNETGGVRYHSYAIPLMKKRHCVGAIGLAIQEKEEGPFKPGDDPAVFGRMMGRYRKEAERRLAFDSD